MYNKILLNKGENSMLSVQKKRRLRDQERLLEEITFEKRGLGDEQACVLWWDWKKGLQVETRACTTTYSRNGSYPWGWGTAHSEGTIRNESGLVTASAHCLTVIQCPQWVWFAWYRQQESPHVWKLIPGKLVAEIK